MRDAPAYQEYAAQMLANSRYRLMSLVERGLLDTLRRECWVNVGLPEKAETLAKMLSFDVAEVAAALPAVMPFFAVKDGLIVCPELDDLRAAYADRRERQAAGGKRSAEKRKGEAASTLQGTSKRPASSLQVCRPDKTKPDQSKAVSRKGVVSCPEYLEWVAGDTDADAYRKAAGGE